LAHWVALLSAVLLSVEAPFALADPAKEQGVNVNAKVDGIKAGESGHYDGVEKAIGKVLQQLHGAVHIASGDLDRLVEPLQEQEKEYREATLGIKMAADATRREVHAMELFTGSRTDEKVEQIKQIILRGVGEPRARPLDGGGTPDPPQPQPRPPAAAAEAALREVAPRKVVEQPTPPAARASREVAMREAVEQPMPAAPPAQVVERAFPDAPAPPAPPARFAQNAFAEIHPAVRPDGDLVQISSGEASFAFVDGDGSPGAPREEDKLSIESSSFGAGD